jgi:hypothetical protein
VIRGGAHDSVRSPAAASVSAAALVKHILSNRRIDQQAAAGLDQMVFLFVF